LGTTLVPDNSLGGQRRGDRGHSAPFGNSSVTGEKPPKLQYAHPLMMKWRPGWTPYTNGSGWSKIRGDKVELAGNVSVYVWNPIKSPSKLFTEWSTFSLVMVVLIIKSD